MLSIAWWFATSSLFLVMMTWIVYLIRIPLNKVPVWPYGSIISQFAGIGMAISAMSGMKTNNWFDLLSIVFPAVLSLMLAIFFLWLLANRVTPLGDLKIKLGDQLPTFKALTSKNEVFQSNGVAGQRIFLKFFRGGWCPYCCADLLRMEQIKDQMEEYGVTLYALSKDTVEEAAIHKNRDELELTLLADPELAVIRQFGVEHQKAFGFTTGNFMIYGVPLSIKPSFKSMAIPTSILVDENGKICWIDQAEDYRLRSSEEIILNEIKNHFSPKKEML